jgi:hypothetical protein
MTAPRVSLVDLEIYERDVRLRMPFRFGVITLRQAPQTFVRVRLRDGSGQEAWGAAAELLAPKWFDKNPQLTNEDNIEQLRAALRLARERYLAGGSNTAFGHFRAHYTACIEAGARAQLNALVANFGPALIDRAILDALCRMHGTSVYAALRANLPGIAPGGWLPEFAGFDFAGFLAAVRAPAVIDARHTVGLVDPIGAGDIAERVDDGLPETLEEVVARYGHRYFKLKIGGDLGADLERLAAIAAVLDRMTPSYHASLDGNEQYDDVGGVTELWRRMKADPRLRRLVASVMFIEQPIKRVNALARDVGTLSEERPVIIDESDDSLDAFPRARELGYRGVSSKTCKGIYKSILNRARCELWNRGLGEGRYFMSAEDLTIQAGLALQQDLALVAALGITHVERNGHHYVNGMAALPETEQAAFLAAHSDLYERSYGAVRVRIRKGALAIGSLECAGFASGAQPDWDSMRRMA